MLVNFFHVLKDNGVPVTPRELLDLLEAMEQRLLQYSACFGNTIICQKVVRNTNNSFSFVFHY